MTRIQLVRLGQHLEQALAQDTEYMEALGQGDWTRVAAVVHRVVGRKLASVPVSVDELHWDGYFVVDEDTLEVVGSCAFKTPPTEDGTVEIAYFTYPGFEGRGYATAMANKLIALASGSPMVRRVMAHTLPGTSASTRVLEKVGLAFAREVVDPEDGRVWRWEMVIGV